jgi:hypothetical protein
VSRIACTPVVSPIEMAWCSTVLSAGSSSIDRVEAQNCRIKGSASRLSCCGYERSARSRLDSGPIFEDAWLKRGSWRLATTRKDAVDARRVPCRVRQKFARPTRATP